MADDDLTPQEEAEILATRDMREALAAGDKDAANEAADKMQLLEKLGRGKKKK